MLYAFMASSTPFQAVALKDLSSMPPVSVTWQALKAAGLGSAGLAGSAGATGSAGLAGSAGAGATVGCAQADRIMDIARIKVMIIQEVFLNIFFLLLVF